MNDKFNIYHLESEMLVKLRSGNFILLKREDLLLGKFLSNYDKKLRYLDRRASNLDIIQVFQVVGDDYHSIWKRDDRFTLMCPVSAMTLDYNEDFDTFTWTRDSISIWNKDQINQLPEDFVKGIVVKVLK